MKRYLPPSPHCPCCSETEKLKKWLDDELKRNGRTFNENARLRAHIEELETALQEARKLLDVKEPIK